MIAPAAVQFEKCMNADESAPNLETPPPSEAAVPSAGPGVPGRVALSLWRFVLPLMFVASVGVLIIYLLPFLVYHWKLLDAHAEAELAFQRRRAELKAEAEHADARLELLDRKAHLASLGFRDLARKVMPVVVNVVNYRDPKESELRAAKKNDWLLSYDPENDRYYVQQSVGSGLIYKPGVILTNHHVVKDAVRLRISLGSGRSLGVDIESAAGDERTDLAVIRLPEKLPAAIKEELQQSAEFADSDKHVHVGDWVLAMGSPLGLRHTVSHGIISAKGRLVSTRSRNQPDDAMELIQTDAAIFPGNSGGPLFDQLGRVVGVNAMIATETGGNQGIAFTIPSNTAKRVAEHLLATGQVPRARLGIYMRELSAADAKKLKIDAGAILVSKLEPGSAAEKAGLKPGDVIVKINKDELQAHAPTSHLRQILGDLDPGAQITIEVVRGNDRMAFKLTLGKW